MLNIKRTSKDYISINDLIKFNPNIEKIYSFHFTKAITNKDIESKPSLTIKEFNEIAVKRIKNIGLLLDIQPFERLGYITLTSNNIISDLNKINDMLEFYIYGPPPSLKIRDRFSNRVVKY